MKFSRLRGTHDVFGGEAGVFSLIEDTARKVFGFFGFEELRTPILEEKELFTRALGPETDVVQKEMYEFEDRSKTRLALRPEGTAGVVRAYLENNFDKTQGLAKFFYMGAMFRSERPQAGRLRQFHQIGVEQLGAESPYADAETIHCLALFLDRVGARGYRLKLNNLGTFEEREHFKQTLRKYFTPEKDRLCEDCRNRLEKNVFRILDCKVESCRALIRKSPPITGHLSAESRSHHQTVCGALEAAGVSYEQDAYMVRGLDYYTKTVFEVSHPKLGAQDAVAAGGRYDTLIESFGGPKTGAVGFAVGLERLAMCLAAPEESRRDYEDSIFIATLGEAAFQKGFQILSRLRANNIKAVMDFSSKSLKGQMRSADRHRCRTVMIFGDTELKDGSCVIKNMADGTQEARPVEDYLAQLISKIGY